MASRGDGGELSSADVCVPASHDEALRRRGDPPPSPVPSLEPGPSRTVQSDTHGGVKASAAPSADIARLYRCTRRSPSDSAGDAIADVVCTRTVGGRLAASSTPPEPAPRAHLPPCSSAAVPVEVKETEATSGESQQLSERDADSSNDGVSPSTSGSLQVKEAAAVAMAPVALVEAAVPSHRALGDEARRRSEGGMDLESDTPSSDSPRRRCCTSGALVR